MTAVMHQALVPYLRQAHRENIRIDPDRVVSLRPEERVFTVLQRWLEPRVFKKLFDGLLELLVENGALPRPVKWFLTAERVRRRTQAEDDLWVRTGRAGLAALAGKADLPGDIPPPDVLVAGHTHVLDWALRDPARRLFRKKRRQQLYVNLGTWTDRTQDASGPADETLPVLEMTGDDGILRVTLTDAESGESMQSFAQP